jgi:hypothetical protein
MKMNRMLDCAASGVAATKARAVFSWIDILFE